MHLMQGQKDLWGLFLAPLCTRRNLDLSCKDLELSPMLAFNIYGFFLKHSVFILYQVVFYVSRLPQ